MDARDIRYLNMDNSPAHSRYSKPSQLQRLYHVSPEPTIHHQEQENSSEYKDNSSIEGDIIHNKHATSTELVVALEALPAKAILPPKPKEPSQKLLKGQLAIPKGVKTTKVQWTTKLDKANA